MTYLLGSDPEMVLLDQGRLVNADDVLGETYQDEFGIDGANVAAELRPKPANDPLTAVANIRSALSLGMGSEAGEYEWQAGTGHGHHPLGGHIHLDMEHQGNGTTRKLITYIGVPLLAMEPEEGRIGRRRDSGYGNLNDVRRQNWGWEYRAPSSWLVSPTTARIAMTLGYLVARNVDALPAVSMREVADLTVQGYDTDDRGNECHVYEIAPQSELLARSKKALSILCKLPDAKKVLAVDKHNNPIRCVDLLRPWRMIAEVLGDWNELRDVRQTWQLLPKSPLPSHDPPKKTEQQIFEGERSESNWKDALVWNEGDNNMSRVRRACGEVGSRGTKIWIVGSRETRGDRLLLSPSLFANVDIREQMEKMCIPFKTWPNYPTRNGDHVIGLPASLRHADTDLAAAVVRYIAHSALGRVQK